VGAFALGRASAPVPPTLNTQPLVRSARGVPTEPALDEPDDELRECQTRLALAQGVLEAQEHEKVGDPVPFPDDLPPQYRPDGFEDAVRRVLDACAATGLELGHVDCTEFPCIAFFRPSAVSYGQQIRALGSCDGWQRVFERWSGGSNDLFMTDDGVMEYSYTAPTPDGVELDPQNEFKRFVLRGTAGAEQLMADVDGRELTELEQLDANIAMVRQGGGSDEMVLELEAQRERLLEKQNAE
jgi:hypothetical protein